MNRLNAKVTGRLALCVGVTGLLAVVSLVLFFVGLFGNIRLLRFMGPLNDTISPLASILSAILASVLYPAVERLAPRLGSLLLIAAWTGAAAHTFGSWLILTGRSDVELSSYYFFLGNGLTGLWVWSLNRLARQQAVWPGNLTRLGMIASGFMIVGLLGLYGIISGSDRSDSSPLVLVAGISFVGSGTLYPCWCLGLGRWIASRQIESAVAPAGGRSINRDENMRSV